MSRLSNVIRRSPRHLVARALDSARRRTRRSWSYIYPRVVTERVLLGWLGASDIDELWATLSEQPFFMRGSELLETGKRFRGAYPEAVIEVVRRADAVLRHEFDLLGSGPVSLGSALPWHTDFKTGRRWPLEYCSAIEYAELDRPTDVKVPWELSRGQHFAYLGQAYWLTGDERYAREFVAEINDWIDSNPLSFGVNWACAMDVALRAVSWIWGFHFFARSEACRDGAFRSRFTRSLFLHGEFVAKHLEKADLNGNHYLCDGVGLVFLGCFFRRARSARRWLAIGRSIVEEEIFAQTTEDGVDFEQSIAYHRLVLEAFLTAYELLRRHDLTPPDRCWRRLERMCEFVAAYTKPDGRAPLIGDADDGRVQTLGVQPIGDHRYLLSSAAVLYDRADFKATAHRCWEETFWLLGDDAPQRFDRVPGVPLPVESKAFADSGFYILRTPSAHVVVDCGEVGFGGRGGHGHNDILSFELFLNGANVVTDCGAYVYTASVEWRNRFRSTAFHNTVQIDGEELNRFISPDSLWQLRYDARPVERSMQSSPRAERFCGGHTGYTRLAQPVGHTRVVAADNQRPHVLIVDRLSGRGHHDLVWRFHLDPAVTATIVGNDVCLSCGVWLMPDQSAEALKLSLADGWVSPRYGVKTASTVIVWAGTREVPFETSFLFADRHLSHRERAAVREALASAN